MWPEDTAFNKSQGDTLQEATAVHCDKRTQLLISHRDALYRRPLQFIVINHREALYRRPLQFIVARGHNI